jgi:hypothetical protein
LRLSIDLLLSCRLRFLRRHYCLCVSIPFIFGLLGCREPAAPPQLPLAGPPILPAYTIAGPSQSDLGLGDVQHLKIIKGVIDNEAVVSPGGQELDVNDDKVQVLLNTMNHGTPINLNETSPQMFVLLVTNSKNESKHIEIFQVGDEAAIYLDQRCFLIGEWAKLSREFEAVIHMSH